MAIEVVLKAFGLFSVIRFLRPYSSLHLVWGRSGCGQPVCCPASFHGLFPVLDPLCKNKTEGVRHELLVPSEAVCKGLRSYFELIV